MEKFCFVKENSERNLSVNLGKVVLLNIAVELQEYCNYIKRKKMEHLCKFLFTSPFLVKFSDFS